MQWEGKHNNEFGKQRMAEKISEEKLEITLFDAERLIPDPDNARLHDNRNHDALIRSIKRFGVRKPIVAQAGSNIVYAGNETLKVCLELGIKEIPVAWIPADKPQAFCKAYAIADNKTTDLSSFDNDALLRIIKEVSDEYPVEDLGHTKDELDEIIRQAAGNKEVVEDDFDGESGNEPISKTGYLWILGRHRVLCGDCTVRENVERVANAVKVNGIFTSPPYAEQRKEQYPSVPTEKYVDWWEAVQNNMRNILTDDGSFFVNIKPHCNDGERVLYVMDLVLAMVRQWGWKFVDELCWFRHAPPGLWPNRFKNNFEPIYHFSVGEKIKFNPYAVAHESDYAIKGVGGGFPSYYDPTNEVAHSVKMGKGQALPGNVIQCNLGENAGIALHSATFPVKLPTFFICAYSDEGDVWLDPFLGSGTTLIAAHQLDRICMGLEILPKYVDVIVKRFIGFMGSSDGVTCERDGNVYSYEELAGGRL